MSESKGIWETEMRKVYWLDQKTPISIKKTEVGIRFTKLY